MERVINRLRKPVGLVYTNCCVKCWSASAFNIGLVIQETKCGATNHPTPAPTPTAINDVMMRLRNSTKCSKNVICPPGSSGGTGGIIVASGGLLVMRNINTDYVALCFSSCFGGCSRGFF